MSRKSRLYELMMKRETMRLRQKADALGGLVGDQTRLSDLDEKLADLILENSKNHGPGRRPGRGQNCHRGHQGGAPGQGSQYFYQHIRDRNYSGRGECLGNQGVAKSQNHDQRHDS